MRGGWECGGASREGGGGWTPGGGGGRAKIENSSRRHPRKFGQKRFLGVREVAGAEVGWPVLGYLLGKIFGGVTAIVSYRPGGWMQQSTVPRCAILSVGSTGGIGQ